MEVMKEAQSDKNEGRRTTQKHAAFAADETGSRDRRSKKKSYRSTMWTWSCTCVGTPSRVRDEDQRNHRHHQKYRCPGAGPRPAAELDTDSIAQQDGPYLAACNNTCQSCQRHAGAYGTLHQRHTVKGEIHMRAAPVEQIEAAIEQLSLVDQVLLMEHLAHAMGSARRSHHASHNSATALRRWANMRTFSAAARTLRAPSSMKSSKKIGHIPELLT